VMAPLEDRAADVWEPLYAIAEAAGGEWPKRARDAAQALTYESEQGDAELLLRHVYDAFKADGGERISSEDLVEALLDRDDGPWAAKWGRDITRSQVGGRLRGDYRVVYSKLAQQLKAFEITSHSIKVGGRTLRGYKRADFNDVWNRLQIGASAHTGAAAATGATSQVREPGGATKGATRRDPRGRRSRQVAADVAATKATSRDVAPVAPVALTRRRVRVAQSTKP
jgi:Protein of unknown function (DUF3631)